MPGLHAGLRFSFAFAAQEGRLEKFETACPMAHAQARHTAANQGFRPRSQAGRGAFCLGHHAGHGRPPGIRRAPRARSGRQTRLGRHIQPVGSLRGASPARHRQHSRLNVAVEAEACGRGCGLRPCGVDLACTRVRGNGGSGCIRGSGRQAHKHFARPPPGAGQPFRPRAYSRAHGRQHWPFCRQAGPGPRLEAHHHSSERQGRKPGWEACRHYRLFDLPGISDHVA